MLKYHFCKVIYSRICNEIQEIIGVLRSQCDHYNKDNSCQETWRFWRANFWNDSKLLAFEEVSIKEDENKLLVVKDLFCMSLKCPRQNWIWRRSSRRRRTPARTTRWRCRWRRRWRRHVPAHAKERRHLMLMMWLIVMVDPIANDVRKRRHGVYVMAGHDNTLTKIGLLIAPKKCWVLNAR